MRSTYKCSNKSDLTKQNYREIFFATNVIVWWIGYLKLGLETKDEQWIRPLNTILLLLRDVAPINQKWSMRALLLILIEYDVVFIIKISI